MSKAIKLEFQSEQFVYYRIEGSNDMQAWNQVSGGAILGDGGNISRYLDAETPYRFYRVAASWAP